MPRRPHRKSRGGCVECKRRHIKCDESRPTCSNCATTEVRCQYVAKPQAKATYHAPSNSINSPALSNGSARTVGAPNGASSTGCSSPSRSPGNPTVDLVHMELLHHYCTVTYETMSPDVAQQEMWRSTTVRIGLSHPFLLYELLALSALHLAYCKPDQQSHYNAQSTELQNQALSLFNTHGKQVDSSNCAAVLLFSALLAHHVFADRSRTEGLDHSQHLDHVLGCISLMRIVRPLVIEEWLPFLQASEIQPLMANPNPQPPFNNVPIECHQLYSLIKASDLTPSSVKAYEQSLDRLLWLFELVEVPHKTHSTTRWVIAWPVQMRDDFFSLLNQRRPEALIILAYYGVVLHHFRKSWAVGNAGELLINAVSAQVGAYWTQWLAWPNKILETG